MSLPGCTTKRDNNLHTLGPFEGRQCRGNPHQPRVTLRHGAWILLGLAQAQVRLEQAQAAAARLPCASGKTGLATLTGPLDFS
jgi:hypothetical protein